MEPRKEKQMAVPRMLRQEIIQEFLSGRKTGAMLAKEYGITRNSINKMVSRYNQKNGVIFDPTTHQSEMNRKKKDTSSTSILLIENEQLKRQLKLAQLKLEGYQIMGNILSDEYGIDLLKKSAAKPSSNSKNSTKK